MNTKKWLNKYCKTLKNKRVVVTGATGGLGKEICFFLAELSANLTLAVRNINSAENLKTAILSRFPETNIDIVELDYSNLTSVKNCIKELKKYNGIDILINNAAVYNVPVTKLDSGYNNIFQINFVYQYYFTKQLLPELEKQENSTCIVLGSIAHNYSKLNENDIDFSSSKSNSKIYGNSKRFFMFATKKLFENSKTTLNIAHPGITLTKMTSHYPAAINWLVKIAIKLLFPKPTAAATAIIFAIFNQTKNDEWIGPKWFNIWGKPKISKLKTATDDEKEKIYLIAEKINKNIK